MMTASSFLERIKSGRLLLSDGATGTNLQARGLPPGSPAESWVFERPEEVLRLHRDFIEAGSDIILTNTFGASPLRLDASGLNGKVEEVNQRAVELARQAVSGGSVLVAGSIGPSGSLLKPYGPLEEEQVFDSFTEQAQALSNVGVDLLVIETQFDINEAKLALEAARSASNLPVVVSFSYDRGTRTMMGVTPNQMAAQFNKSGADVLGVNCGKSLDDNLEALKELRAATDLPLWFKPNAGLPEVDPLGNSKYTVTPEALGDRVRDWVAAGASVVGGCCGTSPMHIAQIANQIKT